MLHRFELQPAAPTRVQTGRLFVDMDGVLADFDTHHAAIFGYRSSIEANNVDWEAVRRVGNFYLHIPPMADMPVLWRFIARFKPTVLTGVPSSVPEAERHKREWVRRHLGAHVKVICCKSMEKCKYARPGDILIDDWPRYRHLWLEKGGIWITHTSAVETIAKLRELGLGPTRPIHAKV